MSESVEKFIRENRLSFDYKTPPRRVWDRIRAALFASDVRQRSITWWRAAAVLFFTTSVALGVMQWRNGQQGKVAMREFADAEEFYASQISEKVDLIHQYRGGESGLNGFTHDFQQLEAMYQVLREEMRVHPSQKVKDALVLNLLVRIDLLNRQLHTIESGEDAAPANPKSSS